MAKIQKKREEARAGAQERLKAKLAAKAEKRRLWQEAKAKYEEAKRVAEEHAFRTPLNIKRMPLTIHHHGGKKK